MTVQTQTQKVTANGNDSATVFSFSPVVIFDTDELVVTKVDANGDETLLSEGSSSTTYSVAAASGSYPSSTGVTGSITYPASGGTPLATGESIVMKRVLTLEQQTDLNNQGGYFPDVLEAQLDKLVMIDLQQEEEIDRALRVPVSDALSGSGLEIPNVDDRKGNFLAFHATTGAPIAATGVSNVAVSAAMDPVVTAASADAALDLLFAAAYNFENAITFDGAVTFEGATLLNIFRSHIEGLTLSNNGTDGDHDIDIAAGSATAADQTSIMTLSATLTKRIDAVWAVGDDAGGLDTGSVANTTLYAVWLIERSDTGVVDALFSTSFTSPTMPTNYDRRRLIGAVRTDGSANILSFVQVGDYFRYTGDVIEDIIDSTITALTFEAGTLSVPPNALAHVYASMADASTGGRGDVHLRYVGAADDTSQSQAFLGTDVATGTFVALCGEGFILADSSSQIQYAATEDNSTTAEVHTLGFHMLTRSNP